ncbi:hypothetical protein ACGIF2_15700 [Cellulomonas sp. P22]|uniref:hypothetical protein n=1 Tax=Cellulomonas sp. P22 TaxID=3373189 RepID=UPI00379E4A6F
MTAPSAAAEALSSAVDDLVYHQTRILLLVTAVAGEPGNAGKLDGLTKLAKLDFLVRYPGLAPVVLDSLEDSDPKLHLTSYELAEPTSVADPMIRYKYGPWDDKYYPIIGALVSKGLLRYTKGRQGSVALAPTTHGRRLVQDIVKESTWSAVHDQCSAVAAAAAGMTGNALKLLIYERLPHLMDRAHRKLIT